MAFLRVELHRPGAKSRYHFCVVSERPQFQCGQEDHCKRDALAFSLGRVGVVSALGQARPVPSTYC
eukprot:2491364-Lingulodinium_polyedra.AAC.1